MLRWNCHEKLICGRTEGIIQSTSAIDGSKTIVDKLEKVNSIYKAPECNQIFAELTSTTGERLGLSKLLNPYSIHSFTN